MPYRVFLSHSHRDEDLARLIKREVEAASKVTVYLAEDDLQPGTPLTKKVVSNIKSSDALLVLVTQSSQSAPWVQQEIGAAVASYVASGKLVVPLIERGADTSRLGMIAGLERITLDPDSVGSMTASLARFFGDRASAKDRNELILVVVAAAVLVWLGSQDDK